MAKKKKTGGKNAKDDDDYWNSKEMEVDSVLTEIQSGANSSAIATGNAFALLNDYSNAPAVNVDDYILDDDEDEQDDEAGGSLMSLVKKQATKDTDSPAADAKSNKKKNNKKKNNANNKKKIEEDEDEIEIEPVPVEQPLEEDEEDEEDASPNITIKSAKQKAKEKKEREKELKKKKAAEKKAAQAAKKAEDDDDAFLEQMAKEKLRIQQEKEEAEKKAKEATAANDDNEDAGGSGDEDDKGGNAATSSSNSKKKKKKKKAAGSGAAESAPAVAAPAPPAGKKNNAVLAALREQMLARQKAEEELKRREEEERLRIEEEERQEELRRKEEEEKKQRKKEKEKAKKEQLKKEGKWLTKSEKERAAKAKARLESLKAAGLVPAVVASQSEDSLASSNANSAEDVDQTAAAKENKPKRVIYGKKKRAVPGPNRDPQVNNNVQVKKDEKNVPSTQATESNEPVVDSWEDAVADSWEDAAEDQPEDETMKEADAVEDEQSKEQEEPVEEKEEKDDDNEDGSDESDDDDDESDDDDDSESDEEMDEAEKRKQLSRERRQERLQKAMAERSKDNLRSPICCILGHVDTGKTKLLDKIRQTNVQEGEAGGITQQIGATYFPSDAIKDKVGMLAEKDPDFSIKVPGLLIIDTPGHESFTNLRSRGSSLCNIAILVVDIMHGLEPQTLESLGLLKQRKTPFIVALNKIDRIYGWEPHANMDFNYSLERQKPSVQAEYKDRLNQTVVAFAEQGLNAKAYYENDDFRRNVSLVPTSAITGEGIPDMLKLVVHLTQKMMSDKLMYLSELECTVLEVKVIEGLGTTIDVILSNGYLHEGDKICICGLNGPIVTQVRALLTPQPLRELRVKSQYVHHKSVKAALGVKLCAPDLEKAIAGSRLMVIGEDDDEDEVKEEVMSDLAKLLSSIDKSGRGVCVQASTLGSLEALLSFLKDSKIPVSGIQIGPVHKKDIRRAAIMLEHAREYAVLLAFDVKVDREAGELAAELGVKIFCADIIYHLFDQFTAYMNVLLEQKRKDMAPSAVFPCILKIVPGCVFNSRSPIVMGVDVVEGNLRVGTPICVVREGTVTTLGKVSSIELSHRSVEIAKKGGSSVAVKIECPSYETPKAFGRHFVESDQLLSQISRASIDVLKESFRDDMTKDDWQLVIKLKKILNIV